ncbi:MAG: hypothetical protein AAB436_03020 [Patescibacteria group bacterium]
MSMRQLPTRGSHAGLRKAIDEYLPFAKDEQPLSIPLGDMVFRGPYTFKGSVIKYEVIPNPNEAKAEKYPQAIKVVREKEEQVGNANLHRYREHMQGEGTLEEQIGQPGVINRVNRVEKWARAAKATGVILLAAGAGILGAREVAPAVAHSASSDVQDCGQVIDLEIMALTEVQDAREAQDDGAAVCETDGQTYAYEPY